MTDTGSSSTGASPETQLRRLASSRAFEVAAVTLERLLACSAYRRQLEVFRGLSGAPGFHGHCQKWLGFWVVAVSLASVGNCSPKTSANDPPRDTAFNPEAEPPWPGERKTGNERAASGADAEEGRDHSLQHLWSWSPSEEERGAGVTALCWNPADGDVLAAGYGRPAPGGGAGGGAVRCWNVKNPVHAERRLALDSAVTALDFSKARPNLAVVCLLDGSLLLVDVSREQQAVLGRSCASPEPLWSACWFCPDPSRPSDEQVLACGQDGSVLACARPARLEPARLARLPRVQGAVRGLRRGRRRAPLDVPVSRHAAALVLTRHPQRPHACYVGTDEGLVHRLATSRRRGRGPGDCFLAHDGPVLALRFSPFDAAVLLSGGADGKLRLWLEAASWQPLLTLSCGADAVQDAAWSPSSSTVLAAAAGGDVLLWELRRRTRSPVRRCPPPPPAQEEDPDDEARVAPHCATLLFTADGRNLAAGDSRGRVHVLALRGAAPAPVLPREALARVLARPSPPPS